MRRAVSLFLILALTLIPGALPASAGDQPAEAGGGRATLFPAAWETLARLFDPVALLDALGAGLDPFGEPIDEPDPSEPPPGQDGHGPGSIHWDDPESPESSGRRPSGTRGSRR